MFTSILRTIVPALWGSFVGWVLAVVPVLEPLREDLLAYADVLLPIISAIIIAAWYAFWRWLEPRLPDWLTRIVLGSAKAPNYGPEKPAYPDIHIDVSNADDPQAVALAVAQRIHYETSINDITPIKATISGDADDEEPKHRA